MRVLLEVSSKLAGRYARLSDRNKLKFLERYIKSLDNYKYLKPFESQLPLMLYRDEGTFGDFINFIEKLNFKIPGENTLDVIYALITKNDKIDSNSEFLYDTSLYTEDDINTAQKIKIVAFANISKQLPIDKLKDKNGDWLSTSKMNEVIDELDKQSPKTEKEKEKKSEERAEQRTVGSYILKRELKRLTPENVREYTRSIFKDTNNLRDELIMQGEFDNIIENILSQKYVSYMGRKSLDLLNTALANAINKEIPKLIKSK
jgi:hypothetical protein